MKTVLFLYRVEMISLLRDLRTMFYSFVLPLLLVPFMLIATIGMERANERELQAATYRYAVGGDEAAWGRKVMEEGLKLARAGKDRDLARLQMVEEEPEALDDPQEVLRQGRLDLYVEALSARRARAVGEVDGNGATADVPVLRLWFRGNHLPSLHLLDQVRTMLKNVREVRRDRQLDERGFPIAPALVVPVRITDLATAGQVEGSRLGLFLPALIFLLLTGGAAAASTDIIAGEKERATLETLLTTAVRRTDIVTSKLLAVMSMSLASTVLQISNLYACSALGLMPSTQTGASVSPPIALLLVVLFVPVVVLSSAVLLLASAWARSFREAQTYTVPVTLVGGLLCLASALPGVELRSPIALLPLSNLSLAVREILVGRLDWPMIAISWLVTLAAALYAVRLSTRSLSRETLIVSAEADAAELMGGPALFRRRVLRWFGVFWAILFVAANSGQLHDLRSAIVFNVVGVLMGGSMLLIRWYRLPPREALALRPVRPTVWLAVLLGAPAGIIVASGIFRVMSWYMPVPQELLEEFSRALLGANIPMWQLLLFVAVAPGICEEVAFRGVLLHGLRRRLPPLGLCVTVGVVFGLFHMDLFRIVPTAFLGMLLSGLTLLTGSILPAMLWHTLHNGLSVALSSLDPFLETAGEWVYLLAAAAMALAFWLIWRNRTPYPDVWQGPPRGRMPRE